MPWRTAIFNAIRGSGQAPEQTRIGLAIVGGVIVLAAVYIALETLRGAEISEMALILFGMVFLTGLALVQAGRNGENSTRSPGSADASVGLDNVDQGPGADRGTDDHCRPGGRR